MTSRKTIFAGSVAILFIAASIIGSFVLHQKPSYDFPLVRTLQKEKEVENVANSTGSMPVKDFVRVTNPPTSNASKLSSISLAGTGALPPHIRIQVPFTVQAPLGNWNLPYQEACEEASIIMVHHFLDGTDITPQGADKEIQDIVAWENTTFHSRADVTAEELQRIAEDYYQYTGQLFYDFSIDDMKRLLAHGYPIIVPLAGRDLGNPYYSGQGPWYHMLVITGYDGNDFITNDVGTKRGKDYRYPTQVVYNAIHDWNQQEEDIHGGRKVILVLER